MRRMLGVILLSACGSPPPRDAPIANRAAAPPDVDRCRAIPGSSGGAGPDCDPAATRNSDGLPKNLGPMPPGEPGKWVVFDYDDFGPQAMAYTLIGMDWWSWEGGGSWEMCDDFDIRVVVYDAPYAAETARRYPTVEGKSDYRLVSRTEAVTFLDKNIADLAGDDELESLRESLQRTRATIDECLRGSARVPASSGARE